MQMSTEKAHMEAAERILGRNQGDETNWQLRKSSQQNVIKSCSTEPGNQRGEKDKKGLQKQQIYANFPANILWVFAIRNNSVTTYVTTYGY